MLSRVLGQSSIFAGGRSIYETLRQQDDEEESDSAEDVEARAGMRAAHYDEQLEGPDDYELRPPADLTQSLHHQGQKRKARGGSRAITSGPSRLVYMSGVLPEPDTEADEVPGSLLVERTGHALGYHEAYRDNFGPSESVAGTPSPIRKTSVHAHWASSQPTRPKDVIPPSQEEIRQARMGLIDPKARAMWRWANVENVDNFLHDVYQYYVGNGIYSIMLTRALNMMTSAFVVGFTTFLATCIDYSKMKHSTKLSQIIKSPNLSGIPSFLLWMFIVYWIWTLINHLLDIRRLWELHHFYLYLLDVPESDMQTITWQEIVQRLMGLRDANPVTSNSLRRRHRASQSKERMDAHDIANRLMRKENYMIALFNKDILDLTVPLPLLNSRGGVLTKAMTWNLEICIMDYVFNSRGQVRPVFLKESERRALSDGLRRRFLFYGWANFIFAPIILSYLVIFFFFRYYAEFQKNPGQIGHRQYTPLAEWKFREFNELWHLFEQRINMSYPFAERYVDQFPKDRTIQVARFVQFIAGSFASVLAIVALHDSELITTFEISPGGTIISYIGILATIIAVARGMIHEEKLVYDPEEAIKYVINYTHYQPAEWNGKLHSDEVKQEFMKLYGMKVMIFLEELLSVVTTPFVMWFSLYNRSDQIIDFFREFTVHVDGIGHVCSYAVFDFKRNGVIKQADAQQEEYPHTENKMLSSYWGFLDQYGPNNQGTGRRRGHPTILSPTLHPHDAHSTSRARATGMQHSISRPHNNASHMMTTSILLDPHHQPPSGMQHRRAHGHGVSHLYHGNSSLLEEEEESPARPGSPKHYKSNLGDPYMSARFSGTVGQEGGDPEEETEAAAGVLGLLNQFHKVQSGGRVVNI